VWTNGHWGEERWDRLCRQLCENFGPASAAKIIETLVYTVGGERITIPSIQDLERRARDRKICDVFRGNYQECAIRFGLSETTIRRVVHKQQMIDRGIGRERLNENDRNNKPY
jgi:Mor family transcriptional regulator